MTNGGWYGGKQYWNGVLGPAGVIINPNQQGYNQPVSSEVNKQSDAAQGLAPGTIDSYVAAGGGDAGAAYSGGDLGSYLNNFQDQVYGSAGPGGGVQTFSQIAADLKSSGLFPSGQAPQPTSLVDQYKSLTEQAGVPAIQTSINDLKAQQEAIAAQALVQKHAEQAKPVATNVIAGRISTEAQQAQEQYDFIGRQLSRKTDELNSALGNIKMIMDFTQQDYQNASASYDRQFSQAISMFNVIQGIQQDQKSDLQRAQDNARANAQIMINALNAQKSTSSKVTTSGGTTLTATQERTIVGNATKALIAVDTNTDKYVSLAEYQSALEKLIASSGVDRATADEYLSSQMDSLGYKKWNW